MHARTDLPTNVGVKSLFICSSTVSRFSYLESFIAFYFDKVTVARSNEQ